MKLKSLPTIVSVTKDEIVEACNYVKSIGFGQEVRLTGKGHVERTYLRYVPKDKIKIFQDNLPSDTMTVGGYRGIRGRIVTVFETITIASVLDYLFLDTVRYANFNLSKLLNEKERLWRGNGLYPAIVNVELLARKELKLYAEEIHEFLKDIKNDNDRRNTCMILADWLEDHNQLLYAKNIRELLSLNNVKTANS